MKIRLFLLKYLTMGFLIILMGCDFSSKGNSVETYSHPQKALLVMDMQEDFMGPNAKMSINKGQIDNLINTVNNAITRNVEEGNLIIYIRNIFSKNDIANIFRNNAAIDGSAGSNIDKRILMVNNVIFDKKTPEAFSNKEFEKYLIKNQVNRLEIVGVYADQCVFYTAKSALNRKYAVDYVKNGVGSSSDKAIKNAVLRIKKLGANIIEE